MGIAAHNYHTAKSEFPPGSVNLGDDSQPTNVRSNWALELLPYVEEQALYDRYNFSVHNTHEDNLPVLQTRLATMLCASDVGTDQRYTPAQDGGLAGSLNIPIAPGSYKGVAGWLDFRGRVWWDRSLNINQTVRFKFSRGVLHATVQGRVGAEKIKKIKDGTSKTLLIGEYMTRTNDGRRTFWASSWRNHNLAMAMTNSFNRLADYDRCVDIGGDVFVCRRSFGSFHSGGVMNFVMCDGSARALPDDIDGDVFVAAATVNNSENLGAF